MFDDGAADKIWRVSVATNYRLGCPRAAQGSCWPLRARAVNHSLRVCGGGHRAFVASQAWLLYGAFLPLRARAVVRTAVSAAHNLLGPDFDSGCWRSCFLSLAQRFACRRTFVTALPACSVRPSAGVRIAAGLFQPAKLLHFTYYQRRRLGFTPVVRGAQLMIFMGMALSLLHRRRPAVVPASL